MSLIIAITECQGLSQEAILTADYAVPMKVIHCISLDVGSHFLTPTPCLLSNQITHSTIYFKDTGYETKI